MVLPASPLGRAPVSALRWIDGLVLGAAFLPAIGLFLWYEHVLAGGWGFPLDDSWIHLQFARNLSRGDGFSFNPGEPMSASTAPLWTLVLTLLYIFPWSVLLSAKVLGLLLLWATGWMTALLAWRCGLDRFSAIGTGLAVGLTPRLVWGSLSGMEITLFTALALAGIFLHIRALDQGPSTWSTALFAFAALARPECGLVFPLAVADAWLRQGNLQQTWSRYWKQLLLFGALLMPFAAFNLATIGKLLPNTYYAKVGPYGLSGALQELDLELIARTLFYYPVLQAQELVRFAVENNVVLALAAPLGLVWCLRGEGRDFRLMALALIAYPLLRGLLAPYKGATFQHGRYAAHLVPLIALLGIVGLRQVQQTMGWEGRRRYTALLWVGVLITVPGPLLKYAQTYGWDVQNINHMQVEAGHWLAQNTPPESVVATHDIGAIGYFSQRYLVDTAGLITPAVLKFHRPGVAADEGGVAFFAGAPPRLSGDPAQLVSALGPAARVLRARPPDQPYPSEQQRRHPDGDLSNHLGRPMRSFKG